MNNKRKYMAAVASTGCVICRELTGDYVPGQVHHIAEGSGERSDYMTVCLCVDHHTGVQGVHGMGVKAFCRINRLPNEFYLLGLQARYLVDDGVIK